ncbi:uncharacterized protein TEOVI_000015900 [Trypanosoma equiperdum]|uniref:Leucine-rich repeat-containing protein 51 n=4 Tax=Trypanozoon TaxID=39700 RepID=Q580G7_TRYB2|nr:hypothetical protein, conserved [Trypanosoma brucei gambiense DAL972]XP_846990.1 hypothetical protein, conserved [Trypanosoma brucei brucei TREU927]AAX79792.1 hypothetical protein, conserved [Trypanosoma brucei]RHW70860.1 hypothetical protein DPX39_080015900 [Trypanosoma brucei equiperdum]SCU65218.1 hypothetical protein, conserved [Trypanosoma equiperdum]AAZ12924.1 hypothetical protein, conserved [Trypanosoma brucei brucei TREU927]CBH13167.1 hypothetical protein, conserved [Trypanosoma bru|eukprot:XP_011775444.1 hypothetical protein, conserved [Trypanosoma brucei gambiense DAL972]
MEFEQLEIGKKSITNAIARQEVTDYYDLLHPNVLLVSHFRYPPLSPVIADTIPALDRVLRKENKNLSGVTKGHNPWKVPEFLQTGAVTKSAPVAAPAVTATSPTTTSTTVTTRANSPHLAGTPTRASIVPKAPGGRPVARGFAARKRRGTSTNGRSTATGDRSTSAATRERREDPNKKKQRQSTITGPYEADIVEGPLLVTARFYAILQWMNQGAHIADTVFDMEARKVVLQESDVVLQLPAPKTEAEWYAQLGRQHTDRNQRLSRLTVTYGRDLLLFRDECYFEDGFIVTIHRFMLTQQEMLDLSSLVEYHQQAEINRRIEAMKVERDNFYAAEQRRVNAFRRSVEPLLDFTFCDVSDPILLLSVEPVAGKRHICKDVRPKNVTALPPMGYGAQQNDAQRGKDQRIVVKARNKAGDEEVYEFVDNSKPRYDFLYDPKTNAESTLQNLADKMKSMFCTSSVRISSCGMRSTDQLVPVLRRLVANAIMTIRALDLSDNEISTLPDLSLLPLQRLLLHKNKISDWMEVENRVCVLPLLEVVTLHGNPISESNEQYRQELLARLLRHPRRAARVRQVDFVTLTAQDLNIAGTFEMFTTGNTSVLEKARKFNVSDVRKKI